MTQTRTGVAQRFADALRTLEETRDHEPLVALFAADADLGNAPTPASHRGPDGAQEFWAGYRETFDEVRSEFRVVVEGEDAAALEWRTSGTLAGGAPFDYTGVTVLEFADDAVTRFTGYFDPSALVRA